jgi:uroporphyrinogen-III decarboxylase
MMERLSEMTYRQRILATFRGERADKIPFFHLWRRLQTGEAEREARDKSMGVWWQRPCYTESMPHVDIVERRGPSSGLGTTLVEYHTPVGTVTERLKKEPGVGEWKAQRSWRDITPWAVERRIKRPEDYEVVKFMVEDTVYKPDYFPIEQAKDWLGDDGVVIANLPHSPMQMLMIDWVGTPNFFIHHARYRDKVEDLFNTIDRRYEEMYKIAAESPADAVIFGDNLDGVLVNPNLFQQYFMPCYEKCAKTIHENGKLLISHFDGRLGDIKHLIAKCPIDIIEAFHPPPMGDLPLREALDLWNGKVLLVGFPGSVYSLGTDAVRDYLISLLRTVLPGDRLAIEASTENLVSDEHLVLLSRALEQATLPLTEKKVNEIEESILKRPGRSEP